LLIIKQIINIIKMQISFFR